MKHSLFSVFFILLGQAYAQTEVNFTFNKNGFLFESTYYEDAKVKSTSEYLLAKSDSAYTYTTPIHQGGIDEYTFDENGNIIYFRNDHAFLYTAYHFEHSYDENNLLISTIVRDSLQNLVEYIDYKYNDKQLLSIETKRDTNRIRKEYTIYEYSKESGEFQSSLTFSHHNILIGAIKKIKYENSDKTIEAKIQYYYSKKGKTYNMQVRYYPDTPNKYGTNGYTHHSTFIITFYIKKGVVHQIQTTSHQLAVGQLIRGKARTNHPLIEEYNFIVQSNSRYN